jgi:phosphatidylglycerophosphate synthase
MRKIPKTYENPLDNIIIDLADSLCPFFHKLGFTPNGITTLSLIFALFAAWALWKGHVWLFAILYVISYFFDCMDGHYARKYNQVTKLGDLYDHVKDIVTGLLIMWVLYYRNKDRCNWNVWIPVIVVFVLFTGLGYAHLGCQEKIYGLNQSGTLSAGKMLCPGNASKNIRWTRWVGMGTWIVVLIACVVVIEKTKVCL